jgi:beta-lactamase class A
MRLLGLIAPLLLLAACAEGPRPEAVRAPAPPPALVQRLAALAHGFDGKVGMAVEDVQSGWIAAYDGTTLYPQQSVSKLWTALAVFDRVDKGAMSLSGPVSVGLADMSVFNQPIQKMLADGRYDTTLDGLLVWALAESDNAADDMLIRRLGGPGAVQSLIAARRLGAIRASPELRFLESKVAGLDWKSEYSFGQAFWTARDQVPLPVRTAKLNAYVADPDDGASPDAIVDGLARLKRGELISKASTDRFLEIMAMTDTGPLRLKAGVGPGWSIAHKTGTGQDLGDLSTGYNDVGLITAPDGRAYAIAVMIAATRRPIPERQALMAAVAQAAVAEHDGAYPAVTTAGAPAPASSAERR